MEIKNAKFVTSMAQYGRFTGIGLPQIAVAGKSNVGKSSLINALCRNGKLAKTSGTPGKTRLLNVFEINGGTGDAFHLIDLPGYGFARVDKGEKLRWGEMMQGYFDNTRELKLVLQLVDIRHEPTQDDIDMVNFLRATGAKFQLIATKADKISRGARMKYTAPIGRALQTQPWELICWSSENGDGRDQLLKAIEQAIVTMPNYFADYDTTVHFISMEELKRDHSGIPHGGFVIHTGKTGENAEHGHIIEYKLTLDSNPEFTSSVLVAYARAAYRLSKEGVSGCKTVFDIAPAYLSSKSGEEIRSHLL